MKSSRVFFRSRNKLNFVMIQKRKYNVIVSQKSSKNHSSALHMAVVCGGTDWEGVAV